MKKLQNFFYQYPKLELGPKVIFLRPNDEIKTIYYLEQGNVKMSMGTLKGEDIILHIFTKGSYFPVMLLLSKTLNKYYFESLDNVVLYKAPAKEVLDLIKKNQNICFDLTKRFAMGLSKLLLKSESIMYQDSYYKILVLLIFLSKKFGVKKNEYTLIKLKLTHYEIASWIGIQRETVSRHIKKLIGLNLIKNKDHCIYVNVDLLSKEEKRYKYYLIQR